MTTSTTKCELDPCANIAHADIQWHTDAMGTQECRICKFHLDEMMLRFKGLIATGTMSFRIGDVGSIVKVKT